MTFEEAALLPRSEKITLVKMQGEIRVKLFTLYSGNIYYRSTDYHIGSVKQDGDELTEVSSIGAIVEGSYYYSMQEQRVYVHLNDDLNPLNEYVTFVYQFYFSSAPIILPYDIDNGTPIEWLPLIESIGTIGQQLDDENTGIVLESNSSIKLINSDGYFDEVFDTLLWENKPVEFYTWFPITPLSEARKTFEGVVESKDYEVDSVNFKVKDFVYRLRDFVNLELFSESDGELQPSLIGTPKRRVYGQVKQMRLAGLNNVLNGMALGGTVTILFGTNVVTGTGTSFLNYLGVGDELVFNIAGVEYKYGIETIISDTSATINKVSEINILNQPVINKPLSSYRLFNRSWHIAGHKLREPVSVITSVIANNRFEVDTVLDLFAGDRVVINGDFVTIRRISGLEIVTETAVAPLPVVTDQIRKLPIQKLYFGNKELTYDRDWTYFNNTEATALIDPLAEFNITQERLAGTSLTFTNGSRSLTTVSTLDFRSILKCNDWIKKNSIVSGEGDWYEILEVKEQEIILRSAYTGTTATTTALIKSVDYIQDDSLITCDCLGMEVAGAWIKTPSDAVRNLILVDAGFESVNEDSFTKAKSECDFILSMVIPQSLEAESPQIRDVITDINNSVFGSLYGSSALSISYSILNSEKPESSEVITDTDILSFSTESTTDIANTIKINYRPFVDIFSGNDAFDVVNYNSGFVDKTIGIKAAHERTIYLYETDKAETIAQRVALFKSMTNTKVTLKGKMNLFLNVVNDKIFLSLDRLYKRLGGGDRLKIGIVTGVKKSETEAELTISDLGNIFNRVPSIAPNTATDYSGADQESKARWGYCLDNDTETPDPASEENLGNGIIG
jgi:hypothetical protein